MISLERFRAKNIERDERIKAEKKAAKQAPRWTPVSLKEMAAACKAARNQQAFVWVWLQYLAWEAGYKPFAVTNERLKDYGISRATKKRALRVFEKAGLISIVRYKRNAPVVDILVHIKRFPRRYIR
jgi:hypothetical protein